MNKKLRSPFVGALLLASLSPAHAATSMASRTSIGPSVGLIGSLFGFGADFRYLYELQRGFSIGLDTGLKVYPTTPLFLEIPVAAALSYEIPTTGGIKPYVGASIGASILVVTGTVPGLGSIGTLGGTFRFLGHFGVHFDEKIALDLGLGTTAGSFTFTPSLLFHL